MAEGQRANGKTPGGRRAEGPAGAWRNPSGRKAKRPLGNPSPGPAEAGLIRLPC